MLHFSITWKLSGNVQICELHYRGREREKEGKR
jgi:hypothetical protein